MEDEKKKLIRTLGYLSTVGLSMAFSVGIGAYIGYYLDTYFQTKPWLFFIFFGLGVVAAFRNLLVMYRRIKDK